MLQWAQIRRENAIYRRRPALSQMLKFNVFGNICIKIESEKFFVFCTIFPFLALLCKMGTCYVDTMW